MSFELVRSEADLFRLLMARDSGLDFSKIRFEGFPRIEMRSSEPMNVFSVAKAISAVEKACRRLYTLFAYGKAGRRLSAPERDRVRPNVEQSADRRGLAFDLTNVANETVRAVRANIERAYSERQQTNLFEMFGSVLQAKLPRLTQTKATTVLIVGVLAAAACAATTSCWLISAEHALLSQKEENRHVEEMFKHTNVQIASNKGGETVVAKRTRSTAEKAIATADAHTAGFLSDLYNRDPLVRLVSNEVEGLRPALLDVASSTGTLDINGVRFTGAQAHRAAREIRRNAKSNKSTWKTTIIAS